MRSDDLIQTIDARSFDVDDVSTSVASDRRHQIEPLFQYSFQTFDLLRREIVRLKCDTGKIRSPVVHEPDGESQRCQTVCDIHRDDFPPALIEAEVPVAQNWMRLCCELETRIQLPIELLIEPMDRHRDEFSKNRVFEVDQVPLGGLVLHVEPVKPAMFREAAIT